MTELHLVAIIVFTGKPGSAARQTAVGTYCHYNRGVVIFLPEITVKCPRVFIDAAGRRHVEAR